MNPFQWYLGKAVQLRDRTYVVERMVIHGRDLSFQASDQETGEIEHLSLFDLLSIEAQHAVT